MGKLFTLLAMSVRFWPEADATYTCAIHPHSPRHPVPPVAMSPAPSNEL